MIVSQILSTNAGELSPRLNYRNDFAKYGSGCRKLENFISTVTGAAMRRPGTDIVFDLPTVGETWPTVGRLIPLQISTDEHVVLVLYDGNAYVIVNGVPLVDEITGQVLFEIPWADADLATLKFKQINDVVYFAHGNYPPHRLKRFSNYEWLLEELDFGVNSPILPINSDEQKLVTVDYDESVIATVWDDGVTYWPGARVTKDGKTWVCQQEHTSKLPGAPESPLGEAPPTGTGSWVVKQDNNPAHDYLVQRPLWLELILDSPLNPDQGVLLSSDYELFLPEHVGSVWRFDRRREAGAYEISKAFGADVGSYSAVLEVQGDWNFDTNGNWYGTVDIQISEDQGHTWKSHRQYSSSAAIPRNVSSSGSTDSRVLMRMYWAGTTGSEAPYGILSAADADIKGWVRITSVDPDGKSATGTALSHMQTMITHRWAESAWNDVQGYPRCVELHQARICYAGTGRRPHTVWGSAEDDYNNFSGGTLAANSYAHTLVIGERDPLTWMISDKFLIVGNGAAEYIIFGQNDTSPIVPQYGTTRRQSTLGCDDRGICAIASETVPLFIQRGGDRVHELNYVYDDDRFVASNLCVLADHIHRGKVITDMALQRVPHQILWTVDNSGALNGYTYERRQEVTGWHRHTSSYASYKAVCVCRGDDSEDHVYLLTERSGAMSVERFGRGCMVNPVLSNTWTDGTVTLTTPTQVGPIDRYNGLTIAATWNNYTWTGAWTTGAGVWMLRTAVIVDIPQSWGGKYYPGGFFNGAQRWVRTETEELGDTCDYIIFVDDVWRIYSYGEHVATSKTSDIYGEWTAADDVLTIGTSYAPEFEGNNINPVLLGRNMVDQATGQVWYSVGLDNVADVLYVRYYNPITHQTLYWGENMTVYQWMVIFGVLNVYRADSSVTDPSAASFVSMLTSEPVSLDLEWLRDEATGDMKAGVPYTCIYEPMTLQLQLGNGTSRSREARIHRLAIDLENSYGGNFGPSLDKLLPLYEDAIAHSGELEKGFQGSFDFTNDLFITSDTPAPFILRGVTVKYNVNGDV